MSRFINLFRYRAFKKLIIEQNPGHTEFYVTYLTEDCYELQIEIDRIKRMLLYSPTNNRKGYSRRLKKSFARKLAKLEKELYENLYLY